jgi:HSP20 family protein
MNRLFDEAFRSFEAPLLFGRLPSWPNVEISETEKELRVSAELPGLEEGRRGPALRRRPDHPG